MELHGLCDAAAVIKQYIDPQDHTLTDKLMTLYLHFTKNLTDVGMSKTSQVFLGLRYYLPEVMDDLAAFAADHRHEIHSEKLLTLLALFAKVIKDHQNDFHNVNLYVMST